MLLPHLMQTFSSSLLYFLISFFCLKIALVLNFILSTVSYSSWFLKVRWRHHYQVLFARPTSKQVIWRPWVSLASVFRPRILRGIWRGWGRVKGFLPDQKQAFLSGEVRTGLMRTERALGGEGWRICTAQSRAPSGIKHVHSEVVALTQGGRGVMYRDE